MPTRPPTLKRKSKGKHCYKQHRSKREFATNDRRWRQLRALVLAEEPLCQLCRKEHGLIVASNEVDHIDGNAMNNSRDNLQALCKPCHSRKTMAEVRQRG